MSNKNSFRNRFKEIIYTFVGKHDKKFRNTRELATEANVGHSNISNFITGRTKSPDHNVLKKLSLALGYEKDFFTQLYLYCEGITNIDPEITHKVTEICENKTLSIKDFFESLYYAIYNTRDKDQLRLALKKDLKDDNRFGYKLDDFINFSFNPTFIKNQVSLTGHYLNHLSIIFKLDFPALIYYVIPLLPKDTNQSNQPLDTQEEVKLFRYPSDNYEKRPVFKATGGQLKQFIEEGFTGENNRMEWGYFKGMPNAFFVEVEGNSMIGDGIKDKDYCLINPNTSVNNGDIVLAVNTNTEATIKKYKQTNAGIILSPNNPDFEPIFIEAKDADHWRFYKVVECRHKF